MEDQVVSLRALSIGYYDPIDPEHIRTAEKRLINYLHSELPTLLEKIADAEKLAEHDLKRLDDAIARFAKVSSAQAREQA